MSQVNNRGNHIPCFPIVAMFASIDVFGDAKNLTPSDDILNGDPACCQPSVELLRLLSQGLLRYSLMGVELLAYSLAMP